MSYLFSLDEGSHHVFPIRSNCCEGIWWCLLTNASLISYSSTPVVVLYIVDTLKASARCCARAYLHSSDEGSGYVVLTRINFCEVIHLMVFVMPFLNALNLLIKNHFSKKQKHTWKSFTSYTKLHLFTWVYSLKNWLDQYKV